jgi:hypothetical protein
MILMGVGDSGEAEKDQGVRQAGLQRRVQLPTGGSLTLALMRASSDRDKTTRFAIGALGEEYWSRRCSVPKTQPAQRAKKIFF